MGTKEFNTDRIKQASPLELPFAIMEAELYDQQSALEAYEEASRSFEGDGLLDNVLNPIFAFVIDGLLGCKFLKSATRKTGLNGQTIIQECKSFEYEGKIAFLNPDACMEARINEQNQRKWGEENRKEYNRHVYEDTKLMGKYKKDKIAANGGRVNMEDEYMMTKNISGSKENADKRRNDPKHKYNAETDHITPLKTIFDQLQNNSGLTDSDIRRIANQDENFAVTANRVNNPKRAMTNSEFIRKQDELKAAGKPYVEITPEQRENMIQMEKEAAKHINDAVNDTVKNNIFGIGEAERIELEEAVKARKKELGRKLTEEEIKAIDKEIVHKKAKDLHTGNIKNAGQQSLMYLAGNCVMLLLKPLYYELKDIMLNGLLKGVGATSTKEAFKIRFRRIGHYVTYNLTNLSNLKDTARDFLKTFISSLIEGLIGMFVGMWKQLLKILKEGIKIGVQAWKICFGKDAKYSTPAEKGDAIVKLVGGSLMMLCGIGIDMLLQRIGLVDDDLRMIISSLLSGLASVLLFYVLDKADLFNVKKEQREKRIREIFDMRIQDVKEKTAALDDAVAERIRETYLKSRQLLNQITEAANRDDYTKVNEYLLAYQRFMAPATVCQMPNWNC